MNRNQKNSIFEWVIAVALSLGCGFLLFGGGCWNSDYDTGKYMMISGIISSPIISIFLHKRLKPKNNLNKRGRILWTVIAFLPLCFLGLFFQTYLGLYLFFNWLFANGLN